MPWRRKRSTSVLSVRYSQTARSVWSFYSPPRRLCTSARIAVTLCTRSVFSSKFHTNIAQMCLVIGSISRVRTGPAVPPRPCPVPPRPAQGWEAASVKANRPLRGYKEFLVRLRSEDQWVSRYLRSGKHSCPVCNKPLVDIRAQDYGCVSI